MVWKELFNPVHSREFRESGLKLSDAIRATGIRLSLFSKVFGRSASPSLDSFEILNPYYYYIGTTRLTAAFLLNCSYVFKHNHPNLQRGQVCHKNWKNLGLYTQKKLQQFFQQHFNFEERRLGFGIFLLLIALCWFGGGGVFCLEFCLPVYSNFNTHKLRV